MPTDHKKPIPEYIPWTFFWTLLIVMLALNFVGGELFGLTHFAWHLFLHMAIIIFSFLIIIYCLRLNNKAVKFIVFGGILWILVESVLFLTHIFEEYYWLETNLIPWLLGVLGIFMLMKGFKEARNG